MADPAPTLNAPPEVAPPRPDGTTRATNGAPPSLRWRVALAVVPALVALWVGRSTLGFGLLADARFLIAENARLRSWADLWPNLTHDYFWSSSGNTIGYWRPLTKASWLAETLIGGGATWPFHAVQVAWFAVACAAVAVLAHALGAWPVWALLAGVVAALHPVAAEPLGLVMARSDVVAAAAGLWSLYAFWRHQHSPSRAWRALHLFALIAALASKEAAVVLPGVLLAAHWSAGPQPWRWRATARAVAPAVLVAVAFLGLRRAVLGDRPGGGVQFDPLRWGVGGGQYALGLLPGRLESGIANLPVTLAMQWQTWLPSVLGLAAMVAWIAWALRRRAAESAPLTWLALSLGPVLVVADLNVPGVQGKIALADRWLLPGALAGQVALAVAVSRLRRRWLVHLVFAATLAWCAVRLATVDSELAAYADDTSLVALEDRQFAATPAEHRTVQDRCRSATRQLVRLGQASDFAGVLRAAQGAEPACQADAEFRFNRFVARVQAGDHATAMQEGKQLMANPPRDRRYAAPMRLLLGKALLHGGRPVEATPYLRDALQMGMHTCEAADLLAHSLEAQGSATAAEAAQWYERAAICSGKQGLGASPAWLAAARVWQGIGQRDRAFRALARAGAVVPGDATATQH
ncbi:MAG: hypothetical protein FJ100_07340 [Deltaproteobacteria bacterium]|nr:hypothetical protein [Deltaproteobacteria bacterium]